MTVAWDKQATGFWVSALLALVCLGAQSQYAKAQEATVCERLASQLDNHAPDPSAKRMSEQTRQVIEENRRRIHALQQEQYNLDCSSGSVIVYGNANRSSCRRIEVSISRLESDIRLLQRRKPSPVSRRANTPGNQRILDAMQANGCMEETDVIIRQSLGVSGDQALVDVVDPYQQFRTLCVRTCDGYYFPISFASSPQQFGHDEERCQNMCPGAEVALFAHTVPDQESEDMVSVRDQTPYRSLPSAFAYRVRGANTKQCSCDYPKAETAPRSSGSAIIILGRDDPEETDNSNAQTGASSSNPEEGPQSHDMDPNRRVRVVGPMFLPDQSEAIDLQAPAPNANR